jgi:hypothetical protein
MTERDGTVKRTDRGGLFERVSELSYYDLVLAVIPIAFLTSVLVGHLLPVSTRTALVAAAVVGGLAVADALFFNPPIRPDGS